jgi:hypothetical protein
MLELSHDVAAPFTSPEGRGRIASKDAMRVRGYALSWDLLPLTRRYAPTSPRWGEVKNPRNAAASDQW